MSNDTRYTAAQARIVENARLVWLDGSLRTSAALTLDAYLAAVAVDDTLGYLAADRDEWAAGHADLVARVAELPAGDDAHAHTFGLRKITPRITRRPDERTARPWLVAPCSCGRVCAATR